MRVSSVPTGALPPPRAAVVQAQARLGATVGGRFSTVDADRLSYARDMWPLALLWIRQGRTPPPPDAVVWPSHRRRGGRRHPSVAREAKRRADSLRRGLGRVRRHLGGATAASRSTSSASIASARSTRRNRTVDVGAGVIGETLERKLNARGWTLGHFPSSIYMLDGRRLARRAQRRPALEPLREDRRHGALGARRARHRRAVATPERPFAGPDLAPLLIGSEGTFCAFTGARLRVFPLPDRPRLPRLRASRSVEKGLEAIRLHLPRGAAAGGGAPLRSLRHRLRGQGRRRGTKAADAAVAERSELDRAWLPALLRELDPRTRSGGPRLMNQLQRVFTKQPADR